MKYHSIPHYQTSLAHALGFPLGNKWIYWTSVTETLKPSAHASFWEATPIPPSLIDMTLDVID